MTILDFTEQRHARRRAERKKWEADMDRRLEEIKRFVEKMSPLFDLLIKDAKRRRHLPRCESPPACWGRRRRCRPCRVAARMTLPLYPNRGRVLGIFPA